MKITASASLLCITLLAALTSIYLGCEDGGVTDNPEDPAVITNLFAATDSGVFLSTNFGVDWAVVTSISVYAFAVSPNGETGTNLFAGTELGVLLSTNNGTSWAEINNGLPLSFVPSLAMSSNSPENFFAGTYNEGVFLSTNNGTSWTGVVTYGLENRLVNALAVSPDSSEDLFAGTDSGVFHFLNYGYWVATNLPLPFSVSSLAISDSNLFAGVYGGVFLSTNKGTSWTSITSGLTNTDVSVLAVSPNGANDGKLFAGTLGGGVFLSTNNGTIWTAVNSGLTNTNIHSFAVSTDGSNGPILFVGTDTGVFLSTNNGTSWTTLGLTSRRVNALAVSAE